MFDWPSNLSSNIKWLVCVAFVGQLKLFAMLWILDRWTSKLETESVKCSKRDRWTIQLLISFVYFTYTIYISMNFRAKRDQILSPSFAKRDYCLEYNFIIGSVHWRGGTRIYCNFNKISSFTIFFTNSFLSIFSLFFFVTRKKNLLHSYVIYLNFINCNA